jgi:hypothetical protein
VVALRVPLREPVERGSAETEPRDQDDVGRSLAALDDGAERAGLCGLVPGIVDEVVEARVQGECHDRTQREGTFPHTR